jgi:hypothetical protein
MAGKSRKKQDSQIRDLAARSGARTIEDDIADGAALLARMQEEAAPGQKALAMLLQECNEEARILEYLLSAASAEERFY